MWALKKSTVAEDKSRELDYTQKALDVDIRDRMERDAYLRNYDKRATELSRLLAVGSDSPAVARLLIATENERIRIKNRSALELSPEKAERQAKTAQAAVIVDRGNGQEILRGRQFEPISDKYYQQERVKAGKTRRRTQEMRSKQKSKSVLSLGGSAHDDSVNAAHSLTESVLRPGGAFHVPPVPDPYEPRRVGEPLGLLGSPGQHTHSPGEWPVDKLTARLPSHATTARSNYTHNTRSNYTHTTTAHSHTHASSSDASDDYSVASELTANTRRSTHTMQMAKLMSDGPGPGRSLAGYEQGPLRGRSKREPSAKLCTKTTVLFTPPAVSKAQERLRRRQLLQEDSSAEASLHSSYDVGSEMGSKSSAGNTSASASGSHQAVPSLLLDSLSQDSAVARHLRGVGDLYARQKPVATGSGSVILGLDEESVTGESTVTSSQSYIFGSAAAAADHAMLGCRHIQKQWDVHNKGVAQRLHKSLDSSSRVLKEHGEWLLQRVPDSEERRAVMDKYLSNPGGSQHFDVGLTKNVMDIDALLAGGGNDLKSIHNMAGPRSDRASMLASEKAGDAVTAAQNVSKAAPRNASERLKQNVPIRYTNLTTKKLIDFDENNTDARNGNGGGSHLSASYSRQLTEFLQVPSPQGNPHRPRRAEPRPVGYKDARRALFVDDNAGIGGREGAIARSGGRDPTMYSHSAAISVLGGFSMAVKRDSNPRLLARPALDSVLMAAGILNISYFLFSSSILCYTFFSLIMPFLS
jgi:hypothetical protein